MSESLNLVVLFGGLALLMGLVVRGKSIFVVAPFCALATVTLSGSDPLGQLTGAFMTGFADYVRRFYLIFALGAAFGKLMEQSGAAAVIANRVGRWLGTERACLAVVLACAVLTYGGVSLFVVGFSVYPLAVQLFRAANLPRQFIPAAIAFGSITFTMTSAGSPEIQNLIPIQYLVDETTKQPLTDARAGWPVSIFVGLTMFITGQWFLERSIRREVARGGKWESRTGDVAAETSSHRAAPGFWSSLAPLLVTLAALNILPTAAQEIAKLWGPPPSDSTTWAARCHAVLAHFPEDATLSIFLGVATGLVTLRRHLSDRWQSLGDGFLNGLSAIGSTASVVGFGSAVKDLPAFQHVVDWVTHLPGDPLLSAALAVAIISALAGSASGGQGIALPIVKPIYVDQLGVAPRALHRVVAISSGTLDSLPHNGYLVMLIRNICGETHSRAYWPICVTTVIIPAAGTVLAIALFKLVPAWATM